MPEKIAKNLFQKKGLKVTRELKKFGDNDKKYKQEYTNL